MSGNCCAAKGLGQLVAKVGNCDDFEALCQQYHLACQLGEPHVLTAQQMVEVRDRMKTGYGIWPKKD